MQTSKIIESDGRSGPAKAGADDVQAHLERMWAAVADSWGEHAEFIDELAAPITDKLLSLSRPRPGERVLELACGPGGLGLAAAARVAPDGEVVLSDIAREMTAIAFQRAEAVGLLNVTTRVLNLERIEEPDGSYDIVLCREGLMFASDPTRAAREIRRVLRPRGRVALAVWGPRERNPWLGILLDAVSAQIGRPVPPPGIPGPFSLADAARLAALLSEAGLEDVEVAEQLISRGAGSFEEWWTRTSALAGPIATILASLPAGALDAIRSHAREAVRAYESPSGALEFPAVTLIAAATVGATEGQL
jgi:SAM-dependent methyltransferase